MKYKIEKGSVQETLLIPLYGRKMAMDLYPDLFADTDCQRLFDSVDFDELIKVDNYYSNEYFILEEKEKMKNEKIACFKNYCYFYHQKFIESDKEINNYEFLKLEIIIEIIQFYLYPIKVMKCPDRAILPTCLFL